MKMTYRQASIIIFYMLVAFKVLSLPSLMYQTCKNDGYLSVLIMMVVDAVLIWVSFKILKQAKDKNIYDFVKQYTGRVVAKILVIALTLVPLIHLGIKTKGLEWFLVKNLYTKFEWFQFAIPIALITCYMIYKGVRNIGRVSEFFIWIIVIGVMIIIIRGLGSVDWTFFLPVLSKGIKPVLKAIYNYLAWFGIGGELLLFAGCIDFNQEKKSKIFFYSVLAIVLVQLVLWSFYGAYGIMSSTHNFAISDISQISNANIALDELSWLIVTVWAIAQILHVAIYGYLCCRGLQLIFNIKNDTVATLILFVALIVWIFWGEHTIALEKLFLHDVVVWVMIVGQYLVPLIVFMLSFIKNKRKHIADETKNQEIKNKSTQDALKQNKTTSRKSKTSNNGREYA
ncbi:MAG: GerAB/ArcD/ProY family transporter [Clostridia bacterium]|nr:GerAB/ArcD/ProY family transporter [Clostridia bacterium]